MDQEKPVDLKLSQEFVVSENDTNDKQSDSDKLNPITPESEKKQPSTMDHRPVELVAPVTPSHRFAKRKASPEQSRTGSQSGQKNEKKRLLIATVGMLFAAFLGMFINMLWPYIQNVYLLPKVTDQEAYRQRKIYEEKWKLEMQSILTDLKNKPKPSHSSLAITHGDKTIVKQSLTLLKERKFSELNKAFDQATTSRIQNRSGNELVDDLCSALSDLDEAPDKAWQDRLTLLHDWLKATPGSPIPHMVLADFYNNYAWKARGSGWGNEVNAAQWLEFKRRLYLASEQLHQALNAGPITPEWFSITQVNFLGAGQKRDTPMYEKIISIGLSDFPSYLPIYLNKTYYLQPRWRGTGTEWVGVITQQADKLGGSEGDKFYARMVGFVSFLYDDVYKEAPNLSRTRVARGNALLDQEYRKAAQ